MISLVSGNVTICDPLIEKTKEQEDNGWCLAKIMMLIGV